MSWDGLLQQLITKTLVIYNCIFLNTRQLLKWQENMANASLPQPSWSTGWMVTGHVLRKKHAFYPKFPWFFPMAMQWKTVNFWQSGVLAYHLAKKRGHQNELSTIGYEMIVEIIFTSLGCCHLISPISPLTSALSSPAQGRGGLNL